MNKLDLINQVSQNSGINKKHTKEVLNTMLELIKKSLKAGEEVKLTGFGKFDTKTRKQRTTINPLTKTKMVIPSMIVPTFKAGSELKKAVE